MKTEEGADVRSNGRQFEGAITEKARGPIVDSLCGGTTRRPKSGERKRRVLDCSETR
jgi:hypothetical protein